MKVVTEDQTGATGGISVPAKLLSDIRHDAVVLDGLTETIAFLENEGRCVNGRITLVGVVAERAQQLANDLDRF